MIDVLIFGSIALVHGAYFLWMARGGAKLRKQNGAQIMPGKGPMIVNTHVWDRQYWDNIEKTRSHLLGG